MDDPQSLLRDLWNSSALLVMGLEPTTDSGTAQVITWILAATIGSLTKERGSKIHLALEYHKTLFHSPLVW